MQKLPFAMSFLQHPYAAGAMLQAGEVHDFLSVDIPFTATNRDLLGRSPSSIVVDDVLKNYSFVFCYCSVYGTDCDVVSLGAEPPVEKACGF